MSWSVLITLEGVSQNKSIEKRGAFNLLATYFLLTWQAPISHAAHAYFKIVEIQNNTAKIEKQILSNVSIQTLYVMVVSRPTPML